MEIDLTRPAVPILIGAVLLILAATLALAEVAHGQAPSPGPGAGDGPAPPSPPSPPADTPTVPPPPAPPPEPLPAGAVPLQHGTLLNATLDPDSEGTRATVQWRSDAHERIAGPNGTWQDHRIEITPSGNVRYTSVALNATILRAECGARLGTGGEIQHSLLAGPEGGAPGPWTRHERASAGECRLAHGIGSDGRPHVNATWQGAGLAWTRQYDFTPAGQVEWTYHLAIIGDEAADRAYGFRSVLAGHPPALNATRQPIGADYTREEALAAPWTWGPYAVDWKDEEHGATGPVSIVGQLDGVWLGRNHAAKHVGQIQADFTHGAEAMHVGDVKTVDPTASFTHVRAYTYYMNPQTDRTCFTARSGSATQLTGQVYHVGVGPSPPECYLPLLLWRLPVAPAATVTQAQYDLTVTQTHGTSFPTLQWLYDGPRGRPTLSFAATQEAYRHYAAAVPANGTAWAADGPAYLLGSPARLADGGTSPATPAPRGVYRLTVTDASILGPLYNGLLRNGVVQGTPAVHHAIVWQGTDGNELTFSRSDFAAITATYLATSIQLTYDHALQPIQSLDVGSQTSRPAALSIVDGSPPYAALTVRTNQSDAGALAPSHLEFRVKSPGDPAWYRAAAYVTDHDDASFDMSDGEQVSYASRSTDPRPGGVHELAGGGPYQWQVRALYSSDPNDRRGDIAGPWFTPPGTFPLCGTPPGPPANLTATPGTAGLTATWAPPPNAPAAECGTLTYSYVVTDAAGARLNNGTGLVAQTFTTTGGLVGNEEITVAVRAHNQYGTGAAATWSGTTPASPHLAPVNFAAGPINLGSPAGRPTVERWAGGSLAFSWQVENASDYPTALPPGILQPSEFEIYYYREATDIGAHDYWQPLVVGTGSSTWPPPSQFTTEYRYTDSRATHFNSPGGFLPHTEYRFKIEPHYSDRSIGEPAYLNATGPAAHIRGASITPALDATGHTLNGRLVANANITVLARPDGVVTQTSGVVWRATWIHMLDNPENSVADIATSAYPATTAGVDCTATSFVRTPYCFALVGGDDISNEEFTAYLLGPHGTRVESTAFNFNAAAPCHETTPSPPSGVDYFQWRPGAGAPAASPIMGYLDLTWGAVASEAPGAEACTYSIDQYHITTKKYAPVTNAATTVHTATVDAGADLAYQVPDVESYTTYGTEIIANGSAGESAPLTVWESTPPWPAANFTATDYPGVRADHLDLAWAGPARLPAGVQVAPVQAFFTLQRVEPAATDEVIGDSEIVTSHSITKGPFPVATEVCYEVISCATFPAGLPSTPPLQRFNTCSNIPSMPPNPRACSEVFALPDPVDTLTGVAAVGAVTLSWDAPNARSSYGILDYVINWTSPYGDPLTPIDKAPGNATSYTVTHLPLQTGSSLRVAAETVHTREAGVVIANATILNVAPSVDFVAGKIDLINETRDLPKRAPHIDMDYVRNGNNVTVEMAWPASGAGALNCRIQVPETGGNYTAGVQPSPAAPDAGGSYHGNLTLANLGARNAHVDCTGGSPSRGAGGELIYPLAGSISVASDPAGAALPLLEWIGSFRQGEWGTSAQFGAFDLVTLIVVIVSMIGFNRSSPALGLIFSIMVLSVAAYFEIIELPTVILGILAMLVMVAVIITRRGRQEVLD